MATREHQLLSNIDRVLITQDQIRRRIFELAEDIEAALDTDELTLMVILHGSILFAADLMRALTLPVYLDSFRVASYHGGTRSSGQVQLSDQEIDDLRGRHVLLVDDILDTGRTLDAVTRHLRDSFAPASVTSCVLLDKQTPRAVDFEADFVGFRIPDEFVVGYGLDYGGQYRNLPFVGTLNPKAVR